MITNYSGATARLPVERGLALPWRAWAFQAKHDGVYAQARTDRTGRIASLWYRSGARVSEADAAGLVGLDVGLPSSVLHGELEAQTEASQRARASRPARMHLFDVSMWNSRIVTDLAYTERYGLLHRWQANVECYTGEEESLERYGWRDRVSGRYVRPQLANLARLPIVALHRGPGAAEALWRDHVEVGGGEGIVAVALSAPLGARASKRKIKSSGELDCVVVGADRTVAELEWRGHRFLVSAMGRWSGLQSGTVVAVRHDGWYERRVEPRFARIVRVRADL